jgi:hypothetical protein
MSWVRYYYLLVKWIIDYLLVKWLGKDAVTPLAVDGKGGKAELLEKVARWVAASGRNVTQPGKLAMRHPVSVSRIDSPRPFSNDCLVRDIENSDSTFGELQDWPSPLRRGTSLEEFRYMNSHFFTPSLLTQSLDAPRIAYIPGTELS